MAKRIELRFFRERYNMDPDYYEGNRDVYARFYFKSIGELKEHWKELMESNHHWFEGETYSAWCGKDILCGGAFDPDDIQIIEENLN